MIGSRLSDQLILLVQSQIGVVQLFHPTIGLWARSLWAISRPLPSEQFLEVWDFRVEACVTQDGDHFVFGDFVIVVATFVDGLDDCVELFLRDHGLFFFGWM
jgi:hypothetical protein